MTVSLYATMALPQHKIAATPIPKFLTAYVAV
jgi:hypothetical protein